MDGKPTAARRGTASPKRVSTWRPSGIETRSPLPTREWFALKHRTEGKDDEYTANDRT